MKVFELGSSPADGGEDLFRLEIESDGKAYWVHQWRHPRHAPARSDDIGELRIALDAAKGRPYYDKATEIALNLAWPAAH